MAAGPAGAASHREAPLIALDPAADITDVYFFRSWEAPDSQGRLIMNVIPSQAPSLRAELLQPRRPGAVRLPPRPETRREGGGRPHRGPLRRPRSGTTVAGRRSNFRDLPISYGAVPPITALDGPRVRGSGHPPDLHASRARVRGTAAERLTPQRHARDGWPALVAVPSNVGPRTMPNYEALAAQGDLRRSRTASASSPGSARRPSTSTSAPTFDTVNSPADPADPDGGRGRERRRQPFGVDTASAAST